ncbi:MAG TPA: hypothetical protein VM680_18450 [Verrucomicrobiae bacterium]|nr:hypothetical protein [Verrucomicrobiae bacterium]
MKKNEPTHVVPPSGGPASAPSVLSPQSSPTPQPSKEVVEASAAEKARARKDALAEAASLLSVACRNSCDVLAQAVENDNPALINQHWRLLQERLDRAAAILKSNVEAFAP